MGHRGKRKAPLDSYRGALTPAQAAEGIRVALENAKELLEEAQILLDRKRFARAASLAILSIEEAGKAPLLRTILAASNSSDLGNAWREYRSHTSKNRGAGFNGTIQATGKSRIEDLRLEDLAPLYDQDSELPAMWDALKQLGFYSDCLGAGTWSKPSNFVAEDLAHEMVRAAMIFIRPNRVDSEAGLALWKQHFAGGNAALTKANLVAFYRAAAAAGIVDPVDEHRMMKFLGAS
jgi:AbiV family abortive infection protein